MLQKISKVMLAAAVAAMLAIGPLSRPASASVGSTYTIIESALALIGGIILYNNYEHKRQAATRIVGYTRNGGTVYGDGRIVMPDGTVIYPGRNGQYPWGQYAYYTPQSTGYTYDYNRTGVYDRTGRHCPYARRYRAARARVNYAASSYDRDDYVRPAYVRTTYARRAYAQRGYARRGYARAERGRGHAEHHGRGRGRG